MSRGHIEMPKYSKCGVSKCSHKLFDVDSMNECMSIPAVQSEVGLFSYDKINTGRVFMCSKFVGSEMS